MKGNVKVFIATSTKSITDKHKRLIKNGFKIINKAVDFISADEIPEPIPPAEYYFDLGTMTRSVPILAISPIEIPQPEIQKASNAIGAIIVLAFPAKNGEYILN